MSTDKSQSTKRVKQVRTTKLLKPKRKRNTQIADPTDYDVNTRLKFDELFKGSVNELINYIRIPIYSVNSDGTEGDLCFHLDQCFCFGIQENTSAETGNITGHSLPICMWNKEGPTDFQKATVSKFTEIVEYCKKYLIDHREDIEHPDLEISDLKKFSPLYYSKDKK